MLKHKHIEKICGAIIAMTLVITILFMNGDKLGIARADRIMGYENRLFDTAKVHTIDIVMNDWDSFIETCTNEEYSLCSIVIDGEAYKNVGIRAKGNSSLSTVAAYGNDRYSFKIEFDQYSKGSSYYGLDKLCLNNVIQDNTYLKDYLTYTMMYDMGLAAPLCSFVYIKVNGEDWGLYLAVEGVEESFLQRNYGTDYGNLYKPDSLGMGGGRGNGKDFNMDEILEKLNMEDIDSFFGDGTEIPEELKSFFENGTFPGGDMLPNGDTFPNSDMLPGGDTFPGGDMFPNKDTFPSDDISSGESTFPNGEIPSDSNMLPNSEMQSDSNSQMRENSERSGGQENQWAGRMGGGMGMGSSDVKLQYIDDDPESYTNIFSSAKTDITDSDKTRLIESLKILSEGSIEEIETVVDVEAVIKYLVVHNFACNGDSYTGSMVHNYYLYEEDGVLSMIPWDYNLAFGSFSMGGMGGMEGFGTSSTGMTSEVNSPIDSPVSGADVSDRPMIAWIFDSEEYTELYHQYYAEFIAGYFESGYFEQMLNDVISLISPYVQNDPTAFCTYEEFETGVSTLVEFCLLRAESISGQLDGYIPSTQEGQSADSSALITASHISSSDMGSMGNMAGGNMFNDRAQMRGQANTETNTDASSGDSTDESWTSGNIPDEQNMTGNNETGGGFNLPNMENSRFDFASMGITGETASEQSSESVILLVISTGILAIGLFYVMKYKRW